MKSVYLPYKILVFFNLLTLLLYSYAPLYSANPERHVLCLVYVLVNIVAWGVGYKTGVNKWAKREVKLRGPFSVISKRLLRFFFLFYILTLLPKYAYELQTPVFDISAMINRVVIGLIDPSAGYTMERGAMPYNWSIYVLISIIDGIFITIGLLSWKKMGRGQKCLFVFLCILDSLKWFGKGTNFGVIVILVSIILAFLAQRDEVLQANNKRIFLIVGLLSLVALWVFAHNMEGRSGGDLSEVKDSVFNLNSDSTINNFIINHLSEQMSNLYLFVVSYLTGGYTNLECAFDVDAGWSFFMGSNPSKANLAQFILGVDVEPLGYPAVISTRFGIDAYISWHSCYAWLANDVGLFGVPFIVFIVGRLTSISLIFYRKYRDLLSGVIFIILGCMCFFFFANNNYISALFYSFIFIFPLWLITRVLVLKKL